MVISESAFVFAFKRISENTCNNIYLGFVILCKEEAGE